MPTPEGSPVTYRMLGIECGTPDAPIHCNCKWDGGHEPNCHVVAAHNYLTESRRTLKNFYKPESVVVWYGRDGKLHEKPFDSYKKARREAKRHKHSAVLYREVKVQK